MSSEEEHCFPQRHIPESYAKQMATQQDKSQAGNFQDLCSLGSAVGRRSLPQGRAGESVRNLWFLFCDLLCCSHRGTSPKRGLVSLKGACQSSHQHPPEQRASVGGTGHQGHCIQPTHPHTALPRDSTTKALTFSFLHLHRISFSPTAWVSHTKVSACRCVMGYTPASNEASHSCSLIRPPWWDGE